VPSKEEYISLAVKLGKEPSYNYNREAINTRIKESNNSLFEDDAAIKELELFFGILKPNLVSWGT
jgi:hypothetical protein